MNYKKLKELTGHSAGIYSLAYDGNFLYSGSADGYVTRWNLELGIQDNLTIVTKDKFFWDKASDKPDRSLSYEEKYEMILNNVLNKL